MSKYTTRKVTAQRYDPETGEVLEYTDRTEVVKNELEPFFLTYSKQIMSLLGKPVFNTTTKVLWKFLEFAEYNTGKVYMNADRVNDVMMACEISRSSYTRAVKELVDVGIVSKKGTTYTIDENMFWKGDRSQREKLREAKLRVAFIPEYDEDGKTDVSQAIKPKETALEVSMSSKV